MRIAIRQTVMTTGGPVVIERRGTLTGETSEAGMRRVLWDDDGYGRNGWVPAFEGYLIG